MEERWGVDGLLFRSIFMGRAYIAALRLLWQGRRLIACSSVDCIANRK